MNYKHLLFIIFSLVIIFYVLWNSKSKIIEPHENQMEYKVQGNNCCGNDPLFLAIKNAGEIALLKDQVKEIGILKQKISSLEIESQNNTKMADEIKQEYSSDANAFQSTLENPESDEQDELNTSNTTNFQPEMS